MTHLIHNSINAAEDDNESAADYRLATSIATLMYRHQHARLELKCARGG